MIINTISLARLSLKEQKKVREPFLAVVIRSG